MARERLRPPRNASSKFIVLRALVDLVVASIYFNIRGLLSQQRGRFLEVGCGVMPYRSLVANAEYVGIDKVEISEAFAYESIDGVIYYEGDRFPLEDEAFDTCFHSQVLEHVRSTREFLREIRRVLKPAGLLIFTVPFSYRYHYIPHDYYRFTPAALEYILAGSGFQDVRIHALGTDITTVCHKIIVMFYRLAVAPTPLQYLKVLIVIACLPMLGVIHGVGMTSLLLRLGSNEDPLAYLVVARKAKLDPALTEASCAQSARTT